MGDRARVIVSEAFNPWFNLAAEDYFFHARKPGEKILFLWRNQKAVVIGRFQNPWIECNLQEMSASGVVLARRMSGGGAVYHDLGNSNFTLMGDFIQGYRKAWSELVLQALGDLGVEATRGPRCDLWVQGAKISGTASRQTRKGCYYHGTLLFHADLARLEKTLSSPLKNLSSRAPPSVPSPVINVGEVFPALNHKVFSEALAQRFQSYFKVHSCNLEVWGEGDFKKIPSINLLADQFSSWEWQFGQSPPFEHRAEGKWKGKKAWIRLKCRLGMICEVESFPPLFFSGQTLLGKRYRGDVLTAIPEWG